MRVLFLNYEYPPLGGGAANATSYILREFSKIPGLEVDLVTSAHDNQYHLETLGQNIRIHKLPIGNKEKNLHFQSQKDLLAYSWRAYWFSRRLISKNRYGLSHSFFSVPCGFLSMLFKIQYKIPYIVSLRGADVPGYTERFSRIYDLLRPLIKMIWKRSDFVVSNSGGLKELALKTDPRQKIEIVYNGVDVENFHPNPGLRSQDKFIITPGASRVTSRKGLNYLIEAVNRLAKKHPNISLKIMGDGSDKNNLEKLSQDLGIKDKVEFLGRIPKEETASYYQEASVFVLPSLNEGMSNALLEALSSGLPIIATDTGGTKELVSEGENGFIIKMKDAQDIAEKIEKLIIDPELRTKMGQKSRKKAEELSWKKVADKYLELYEKTQHEE
jgi:glycosyltransferase involved in cell wall biosynthesis